jgi:hypothetical protein
MLLIICWWLYTENGNKEKDLEAVSNRSMSLILNNEKIRTNI